VSTKEPFEVAELLVLKHDADRVIGEADAAQSGDIDVVQTRHYARFTLKVHSANDTFVTRSVIMSLSMQ